MLFRSGYVAGAVWATGLELVLCFAAAARHAGLSLDIFRWLTAPGLASLLAGLNANLLLRVLRDRDAALLPSVLAVLLFGGILYLAALQAQGVRVRESIRLG